jgi:hypothetical protein
MYILLKNNIICTEFTFPHNEMSGNPTLQSASLTKFRPEELKVVLGTHFFLGKFLALNSNETIDIFSVVSLQLSFFLFI